MMPSRLRLTLGAILIGLLAGCATIPTSGPVTQGNAVAGDGAVDFDIIARGPQAGASQEEILRGFLDAAASPQADYGVARSFLTSNFSRSWRPDAGTTIDRYATRSVVAGGPGRLILSVFPVATVSDTGSYAEADAGDSQQLDYQFSQVDGEWRISNAPQGIVLDEATFPIVFRTNSLYFYSPDGRYLVPDVRWFARRESTQTAVLRALLAGPREWLAPGVRSAIPTGTTLDGDSVPVVGQVATVSLTMDTLPSPAELGQLTVQLQNSLLGVTGVSSVALEINGAPVSPTTLPNPIVVPRVDSRPAVLTESGFGFLSTLDGSLAELSPLTAGLEEIEPSAIALGASGQSAAALNAAGVWLVTAEESQLLLPGANWLPPVIDPSGTIWSAREPGRITWVNAEGVSGELVSNWGDGNIQALSVSRDGTRLIAALDAGAQVRIVATAIIRPVDGGVPTGLGDSLLLTQILGGEARLDWVDPIRIAVLSRLDSSASVTTITVGGTQLAATAPASAIALAGGNVARELRLRSDAGALLVASGAGWQARAKQISVLATQIGGE